MPIEFTNVFRTLTNSEFESIDYRVMGCAFASQNELGRLCEERVYENDLAARLRAKGMVDVYTQLPVVVSYNNFRKVYRIDIVVNGILYELKAVSELTTAHEAQGINYSALLGLDRFKLINFGSESVEGRLKRCPFFSLDRKNVAIARDSWKPLSKSCDLLIRDVAACLHDWGGFLEASIYNEALVFLNGGEDICIRRLPVSSNGVQLGHHCVKIIEEDIAFEVTSLADVSAYEKQLNRLFQLLPIRAWHLINIYHSKMTIVTLTK
ncbi:MAG: GxxExxY protein [Planctomycetaceae bacterium]|nr:GxxExxY protein [Planctomycetaceae bacterium]